MVLTLAPFFLGKKALQGDSKTILIRQRRQIIILSTKFTTGGIVLVKKSMQTAAGGSTFIVEIYLSGFFGRVIYK